MGIKKIDHVGIAVEDLEGSLKLWARSFRLEKSESEAIPERGVRVAYLYPEKGPAIELITPLGEESPVKKFLENRGEGVHHICFQVKDLEQLMAEFKAAGISFLQEDPVRGAGGSRVAFIHPRVFNGVLIEFKEKEKERKREKEKEKKSREEE